MLVLCLAATLAAGSASAVTVEWKTADGGNGHSYAYVAGSKTWTQARAAALASGGYLATITSAEENAFLAGIIPSATTAAWFGANDVTSEGTYVWADGPEAGQTLTYFNWHTGEPNNNNVNSEDFIHMNMWWTSSGRGKWNDLGDMAISGYLVEFNPPPVTTVPLPAGLPLVLGSLGMLALLKRRR